MKKVITVCLCLIVALSALSVACAEDFTIHAGTMFGDTLDDVKAKETLEIFSDYDEEERKIKYMGEVAGYDNTLVVYNFNEEGKVYDVSYMINAYSESANEVMTEYEALESALTKKYGEPLKKDDENYYIILGKELSNTISGNKTLREYGLPTKDYEYIGWICPCEGYNVKIELIHIISTDSSGTHNHCYISYHPYTEKDFEEAKTAYEKGEAIISDDL